MLLLVSTSDKIQVITSAAADVDVHASYTDLLSGAVTPGRKNTAITTATTTDVVASPAASTSRNVQALIIRNKHASSPQDVTVIHTDGTTAVELHKCTLLAGECLTFMEGQGWQQLDVAGNIKVTSPAAVPITVKALSSDQSNSTTTATEVTGLTVPLQPGTYAFEYYLIVQAAAATTGLKFSVNFDGTQTAFVANVLWGVGVSASSDDVPDQDVVAAAAGVWSHFAARAPSTAGWGVWTDVDTAAANIACHITGTMVVSAAGNLELWHGSEVAAASTVKAGSSVIVFKTS